MEGYIIYECVCFVQEVVGVMSSSAPMDNASTRTGGVMELKTARTTQMSWIVVSVVEKSKQQQGKHSLSL